MHLSTDEKIGVAVALAVVGVMVLTFMPAFWFLGEERSTTKRSESVPILGTVDMPRM